MRCVCWLRPLPHQLLPWVRGGDDTCKTHRGVNKNARSGARDFAVAKSVVDKARLTLAKLKVGSSLDS